MAINIKKEEENVFNPQMIYNATANAVMDAYDDGFMNQYIMEHALYCHLLAQLKYQDDEEECEEISAKIHKNPLVFWMENIEEIKEMVDNYEDDLMEVSRISEKWYSDYTAYAYSMRGMLDNLSDIMTGVTQRAEDELQQLNTNGDFEEVRKIAQKWGIDNSNDSLFDNTNNTVAKKPNIVPLALA